MAEESRSLRELLFERVDKLAGFMQIVIWLIGDCLANPFRSIEVLAKRIGRGGCREIGNNVASVRERACGSVSEHSIQFVHFMAPHTVVTVETTAITMD